MPATSQLDRWATRGFIVYLVVALPVLLALGSYQWFFADEWEYLTNRAIAPDDLFRHHYGHWVTTPVLVYRGLFTLFGLRSYVPYQVVLVVSHLVGAWLLFVIARRSGVRPWIAACVVSPFVLFGPGSENIVWAFQIAFTFAFVFGLSQLLLAGHDGPIDRRDWLALGAGAISLTCSGVAPALVLGVGAATFIRRGFKPALFQTLPLGVLYVTWYVLADPQTNNEQPSASRLVTWVWESNVEALRGLGHWSVLAAVLAVVLVVGLVLAWRSEGAAAARRLMAAPIGLLVASIAFQAASGAIRATGVGQGAASSRYVYVSAGLALPALAVAAQALVRRWRPLGPVVALLFLVPLVANLGAFEPKPPFDRAYFEHRRALLVGMAYSPYLEQLPASQQVDPGVYSFREMDVGFLRAARRDGRLPPQIDERDPVISAQVPIKLGLVAGEGGSSSGAKCTTHSAPVRLEPDKGDLLRFGSPVNVTPGDEAGGPYWPVTLTPRGRDYEVVLPDLTLVVSPPPGETEFVLC